jgi:CDP-diglyceride synthetase
VRNSVAGVVGFLVAPLVAAVILSATTRLFEPTDIIGRAGMLPVFYSFAVAPTLLLGLPAFLIFRRLRMLRWWSVMGTGMLIGALMGTIVGAQSHAQNFNMLLMGGIGAVAAGAFWLIWMSARSTREAES